jgi:hypothetical protein
MSSDEIIKAARQRLILAEPHIREKAKEAEAKMWEAQHCHNVYEADKWEAVCLAYEECYKLIFNKEING